MDVWYKAYPALSFSFISVMPSLDTSLLKTRIPITMLTCRREKKHRIKAEQRQFHYFRTCSSTLMMMMVMVDGDDDDGSMLINVIRHAHTHTHYL